jgi:N-methylhydantoinase A
LGASLEEAALGIIEVANAHMERALRVISVERGYDPEEFTLLSFGGAGGLHASALARRLGIPRVLVPPLASTLSAYGMLSADIVKDASQTVMLPGTTPAEEIDKRFEPLEAQVRREAVEDGAAPDKIVIEKLLDSRYQGQSYEIPTPWPGESAGFAAGFHALHQQAYGYQRPEAPLEIVNLRLRATAKTPQPAFPTLPLNGESPAAACLGLLPVFLGEAWQQVPVYRFEALQHGNRLSGPALIARADTSLLLDQGDQARMDGYGNLVIL